MTMTLWMAVAITAAVLVLVVIILFNRFVRLKHQVDAAWSDIDVQLKRRYDLIPKLVDAVKAYGSFEQTVNLQVTRLRKQAESGAMDNAATRATEESKLSQMMLNIFALAEAYPQLKASRNFLDLQNGITEVEEHIQYARRFYNGAVRQLNVLVQQFPSNLIAKLFRFREADYFEVTLATERQSPELEF